MVRVTVYERTIVVPGAENPYRYEPADTHHLSWDSMGVTMSEAPQVGDVLNLPGDTYKVVARSWNFVGYGTVYWPYGSSQPTNGHECCVLVEPCMGIFANEADLPDDDEEEEED